MKKIQLILTLTLALFAGQTLFGQCTPDTNPTVPGFYPDTFPDGRVNVMYDGVMSAVFPKDTTVSFIGQQISASFCAFQIDTIFLPPGLTYECDKPGCVWDIDHSGVVNRGCIRITGTPTARLSMDSVDVVIKITPGYIDSARNNICNADSFRNAQDPIILNIIEGFLTQTTQFQLRLAPDNTGIEDLSETLGVSLYPNPADTRSQLEFNLTETKSINVNLLDGMGRLVQDVYSGNAIGLQRHDILTGDLAPGLYLVRIEVEGEGQVVRKLTVQ